MGGQLVVGFDLDMTLIDTAPGFADVLRALGAEPLTADAVREYATGRLADYKIPGYVMVVDEFPMTVTGKIRKVEMREETADQLGLVGRGHESR